MPDDFDVYHKWLGIPPEDQPPDHYRLLSIKQFESDPDVIESAADRQMAHLRTYQSSKHAELSQRLLNELSAVRVTLLNSDRKAAYDENLRQKLASHSRQVQSSAVVGRSDALVVTAKPIRAEKKLGWLVPVGIVAAVMMLVGVLLLISATGPNNDAKQRVAEQDVAHLPRQQGPTTTGIPSEDAEAGDAVRPDEPTVDRIALPLSSDARNVEIKDSDGGSDNESSAPSEIIAEQRVNSATNVPETFDTHEASTTVIDIPSRSGTEFTGKSPVPTAEEQKAVNNIVADTFQVSKPRTPEEQLTLAHELAEVAGRSADPTEKFVLLRSAMKFAGEGGDAELVIESLEEIDRRFEIDRLEVEQKTLLGFASMASTKDAIRSLAKATSSFLERAMAERRLDLANEMAGEVYDTIVRKPAGADYRKQFYDQRQRVGEQFAKWSSIQEAFTKLETTSNDPSANLIVGKWYCFERNDWKTGLPYLAKSNDPHLKTVAVLETGSSNDQPGELLALADAWWGAAEQAPASLRGPMQRRAGYWYKTIELPSAGGLDKLRIQKRLEEIAQLPDGQESTDKPAQIESVFTPGFYELIQSARRGAPPGQRDTFQFTTEGKVKVNGSDAATWEATGDSLTVTFAEDAGGTVQLRSTADDSYTGAASIKGSKRYLLLVPVKVIAIWEHSVSGGRPLTFTFYSNGSRGTPDSKNTWSLVGNKLTMRSPNPGAPGGAWVDTVTVAPDGKSYNGKNNIGVPITGRLRQGP